MGKSKKVNLPDSVVDAICEYIETELETQWLESDSECRFTTLQEWTDGSNEYNADIEVRYTPRFRENGFAHEFGYESETECYDMSVSINVLSANKYDGENDFSVEIGNIERVDKKIEKYFKK